MVKIIQKIGMWLFNIKPGREVLHEIDEETIKKDKLIENLSKKIASQEALLAKVSADKSLKKENKNKEVFENKIAKNLKEEESELNVEKYGKWFSWSKLERKLLKDPKFRKKFRLSDKNGEEDWGYGELLFSTKGFISLSDSKGKIKIIAVDLKSLIHHIESIFNQYKIGRILLARDKGGDYIPGIDDEGDLDDFETEIPTFDEKSEEYNKTTSLKLNARQYILKQQDKLREKDDKIKLLEFTVNGLRVENTEWKRNYDTVLHAGQLGKAITSEAQSLLFSQTSELADITRKISNLQEGKVLLEKELSVKEDIIKKLLLEIEKVGDQDSFKRATAVMREAREFERANPSQSIVPIEKEQKLQQAVKT
jgi:hypothetical protein